MVEKETTKEILNLGKRIIIFIGPEGSGKTTIAKRLADETQKPYITTGDIIRDLAANDTGELGDECREMFANHTYLKGETLLKILVDRFSKDDTSEGFILDGGLRTLEETVDFKKMLIEVNRDYSLTVIQLDIPKEVSYERLLHNKGARRRSDDTPEGIESRLKKYYYQLEERITSIKSQENWRHISIDATPNHEKVYRQLLINLTPNK